MIAWIFPGQGSQKAGMASGIAGSKELFAAARPIIGNNLEKLCTVDTDPTWTSETVQQALFITSVAAASAVQELGLEPDAMAGHSLGEFPALVAAGALSFEDGMRLVDIRARAMGAAGRRNPGGMAAVIGLEQSIIEQICADEGDVWVANLNSPRQTVISGKDQALAAAAERCLEAGARRVVKLQVPLASHCPLMEDARTEFAAALEGVDLQPPAFPIYFGADGAAHTDPAEIAALLAAALTSPVRFADVIRSMRSDGVATFVECGPGKVLRGLVRQIDPDAELAAAGNDEEAAALADSTPPRPSDSSSNTRRTTMATSQPAVAATS